MHHDDSVLDEDEQYVIRYQVRVFASTRKLATYIELDLEISFLRRVFNIDQFILCGDRNSVGVFDEVLIVLRNRYGVTK